MEAGVCLQNCLAAELDVIKLLRIGKESERARVSRWFFPVTTTKRSHWDSISGKRKYSWGLPLATMEMLLFVVQGPEKKLCQ